MSRQRIITPLTFATRSHLFCLYIPLMMGVTVMSCAEESTPSLVATPPIAGEMVDQTGGNGETGGETIAASDQTPCVDEACPTGRLVFFDIPSTADDARALGCQLQGRTNGSALSLLLRLADIQDPSALLHPDEMGVINLVAFMRLTQWTHQHTVSEARPLDLHFLFGEQEQDGTFSVSESSYDASGEPLIHIPESAVLNGILTSPPVDVALNAGIFGDAPIRVQITQASVGGPTTVSGSGFTLNQGYVQGYLTRPALINFVTDLKSTCSSNEPPDICTSLAAAIEGEPAELLDALMIVLGGFDGILNEEGQVNPCDTNGNQECDTLGLCVKIGFE